MPRRWTAVLALPDTAFAWSSVRTVSSNIRVKAQTTKGIWSPNPASTFSHHQGGMSANREDCAIGDTCCQEWKLWLILRQMDFQRV